MNWNYLACDLGAESGRLMWGRLTSGKLCLEELHRFSNTPLNQGDSLRWNIPMLFQELEKGLKKSAGVGASFSSVSADSWGVDYVLLDAADNLMAPTYHYRDKRTARGVQRAFDLISWPEVFARTGIQFMALNTLFQLMAETPERLNHAKVLLGIGDAVNHHLSGVAQAERSLASTMQIYDPVKSDWSYPLLQSMGLPSAILPPIVASGTVLGALKEDVASRTGLKGVQVVATCSHDTGAAVVGVPASGDSWAYLSSGTWSLLGLEMDKPIISDACRDANFTNEIGYGNTVRLLKNIVGLWIVQECRREWAARGVEYDYATLTRLASEAPAFVSLIDPADSRFLSPGNMPSKVADFCSNTGQPAPVSPGATIRCVLESLALLYRKTLQQAERVSGHKVSRLHIVGGGSRNELLNQFTANAVGLPVITGPVEATAIGNVLVQAIALGHVSSLDEARRITRNSFETISYSPTDGPQWEAAYGRFENLCS